uniref:Uncharacterized protein n=1 Tax=Cryptomonas curvata TaxID=233186 RepID=A0A7S0M703_9CRYP|mmetsp:Transcript_27309/g.56793  ORF Transcript_27309/g.56793 Transcript_27309/m.56793 type:complete len:507 (+) Transcript_27309:606-2126(+)
MSKLRNRLRLTQRDGFYLNSEHIAPWRNRSKLVVIKESHLEAAARLEIGLEFDMNHFDAFSLSLEEEKYCNTLPRQQSAQNVDNLSIQYNALTLWMLEISDGLIRPDFGDVSHLLARKLSSPFTFRSKPAKPWFRNSCANLLSHDLLTDPDARFHRFIEQISKARIWKSDSNYLFLMLKDIVQGHLNNIAKKCEKRFGDLSEECMGIELKALQEEPNNVLSQFEAVSSSADSKQPLWYQELKQNIKCSSITKQNHEEVKAIVIYDELSVEAKLESSQLLTVTRCLNEDVFISQLHRRAKLLDGEFQIYLANKIKGHATQKGPDDFFGVLDHNSRYFPTSSSFTAVFPFEELSQGSNVNVVACDFCDSVGVVEIVAAPIKTIVRMREKLMEYATAEHFWPLSANILDPVRASIVCEGPSHILQVLNWFFGKHVCHRFSVVRVKNKFAFPTNKLVGGYRDLLVCVVFEGCCGLKIIAEIQIQDRILHNLKQKMHKLYKIQRSNTIELL